MTDGNNTGSFATSAQGLAKNPLGIIGLFLVLVYGLATLVATTGSLSPLERLPLIYFLVFFPVLVLIIFTWLVIGHSSKLFSPADFKNEENYVKMQMYAVASLTAAKSKDTTATEGDIHNIVQSVGAVTQSSTHQTSWKRCILWVDDRPDNNFYERQAFEAIGLEFSLSENTDDALAILHQRKFAAVISDMGRREGPREGYKLLDGLRVFDKDTPLFFYAASRHPEHVRETFEHGGQGCTNNPEELFNIVTRAVLKAT